MHVGFETTIWGNRLDDLRAALDVVAAAGYEGVEFGQRPDALRIDSKELQSLLRERKLRLLSFSAGTLRERMDFCGDECRPEYLYIEDWDAEFAPLAIKKGFTLALHPLVFSRVRRLQEAFDLIEEHPELRLLLDTAHLMIAGDDPTEAVRRAAGRIAAVHFKDWSPKFGRACHRFARGFTELGEGIVDLRSVLQALREIGYTGWVVAELDNAYKDPRLSALNCAKWFARERLLPEPPAIERSDAGRRTWAFPGELKPDEARFMERLIFGGASGSNTFYDSIAAAFYELIPSHFVSVWTCSPAQDHMGLRGVRPFVSPDLGPTQKQLHRLGWMV